MKRSSSIITALAIAAIAIAGGIASCKQGEGQRCQVNSDCEDGLVCNTGEGVCRTTEGSQLDAEAPPDAAPDAM